MKKELLGEIVDTLVSHKVVLRRLDEVDRANLETRKKLACFLGVDTASHYVGLWRRFSKSKLLIKEVNEFLELQSRLEYICEHRVLRNFLLVESTICSKAIEALNQENWKVLHVSV